MRRIAIAFLLVVGLLAASPPQAIEGTWSGMLAIPGEPLLFVITIARNGGALSATASSPYQSGGSLPVDAIVVQGSRLHFGVARFDYSFDGVIGDGAITGTFTQRGTNLPLTLVPSSLGTSELGGTWLGSLHVSGMNLLLAFHFARGADRLLTATFDSPFQHGYGISVDSVIVANDRLTLKMAALHATYEGTLGSQTIGGTFTQNGVPFPLTLSRPGPGADVATPAPIVTPYPLPPPHFASRNVTFASSGGAVLSGTLTLPDAQRGRLPAFVFVHGSGPGTRNGGLPQNPTFLDLSTALSNADYIVLRYDKRGIGASTGVATEDWHVLGGDVRAAAAFLRRQPGVDPNRIFLLGHSEGGIVVPLVAPSIPGVAGIVLMAPPAVPMERILDEQSHGQDSSLLRAVRGGLRSYDGIDPASVIRTVSVPILVLQGTQDIQILPSDLHHLTDAARAAHKNITVDLLGGDDHLFLEVPPGSTGASEYTIPAPLDPRVAADILLWLRVNRL